MRHSEKTQYNNRPVEVAVGYDVRLEGWFMLVTPVDDDNPDANEDTGLIYSNLDDKNIPFPGLSKEMDYYKGVLRQMNITVSSEFFGKVRAVCD